MRALTVGIFAVGGAVGGLASGKSADWLGRKGGMFLNDAIALVAAVLMTCAKYVNMYPLLIAGRFAIGINAGSFFFSLRGKLFTKKLTAEMFWFMNLKILNVFGAHVTG